MNWNENAGRLVNQAGHKLEALMPVLGVSTPAAVGHYLKGRRQPKPHQLKSLADFLGVKVDDFFSDNSHQAPDQLPQQAALREQLQSFASTDIPVEQRYNWSNPGGLSGDALILKVLRAGRFADILALAEDAGMAELEAVASQHPELAENPWLQRKLNNIRVGLDQHAA